MLFLCEFPRVCFDLCDRLEWESKPLPTAPALVPGSPVSIPVLHVQKCHWNTVAPSQMRGGFVPQSVLPDRASTITGILVIVVGRKHSKLTIEEVLSPLHFRLNLEIVWQYPSLPKFQDLDNTDLKISLGKINYNTKSSKLWTSRIPPIFRLF